MNEDIRVGGFNILPPVVKNLLIINALFFLLKIVLFKFNIDLDALLGLHYFAAQDFHPWQPLTYMFMHNDFGHLFFNMFALWMFGAPVENYWGGKRFLIFYLITGLGAGLFHYIVLAFQILPNVTLIDNFVSNQSLDNLQLLVNGFSDMFQMGEVSRGLQYYQAHPHENPIQFLNQVASEMPELKETYLNLPNIIGASGSVFGLLLAFGMLFPNSQIYLYFLIPIKAKWFVIIYGAIELFYGVTGTQDGVGHFAHLGGMLFGFILIMLWRRYDKKRRNENQEYYY